MTIKLRILKIMYPAIMWLSGLKNKGDKIKTNVAMMAPIVPIYTISTLLINDKINLMESFKGKKILIVNTASDCGFTNQYEDLEKLYKKYNPKLVLLAFPSNDFKNQETGTNEAIASFCKLNFGVTFSLMKKSSVIKNDAQNEVFKWLSDANKNGWNNQAPLWNFTKYLVNEQGVLTHYFDSSISPLSHCITEAIG